MRESPMRGLGVFAVEAIASGQTLRELRIEREITSETPLLPENGEHPDHCVVSGGRLWLVAKPECYINHSCDPNVWLRVEGSRTDIVARRDIEPGCEFTLDYLINNEGGNSWPCHCGAARCRGETGLSFFTLPEEFQREYLPLLAPWFREAHAARLRHLVERDPPRNGR